VLAPVHPPAHRADGRERGLVSVPFHGSETCSSRVRHRGKVDSHSKTLSSFDDPEFRGSKHPARMLATMEQQRPHSAIRDLLLRGASAQSKTFGGERCQKKKP
jgi:hypothetical protein